MTSITPSTLQVNEGKSLTTSLSGFTPGTTLYFKVSGRGISKKDFSAGALKGSIKVDANGVATISHTLRADKTTEGSESFAIQVFSDKKMRNLLGQSDCVSVLDTSGKAGKAPKGGGSETKNTLTLRDMTTEKIVLSDQVYNGFFTPATDKNRSYSSGQYEIEANNKMLIFTLRADGWKGVNPARPERFDVSRAVLTGRFTSDANGNFSGEVDRITSFNLQSDPSIAFFMETAESYNVINGTRVTGTLAFSPDKIASASYFYSNLDANEYDYNGNVVGNSFYDDGDMRFLNTPLYQDSSSIKGLAATGFFQEGWCQDPFAPNLI